MPHKDPEVRKKWQKEYLQRKLREDPNWKKRIQKRYRDKPENKVKAREYQGKRYRENPRIFRQKLREYRRKNPERVRKWGKEQREKHHEQILQRTRDWREQNREKILEYRARTKEEKNQKQREKYRTNIGEYRKKNREVTKQLHAMIIEHYSKGEMKCICCNSKGVAFLTIDHIEGRKKVGHTKGFTGEKLYRYLRRENFPIGYQVLCWNCNQIKEMKRPKNYSQTSDALRHRKRTERYKLEVLTNYSKGAPRCGCCGFTDMDALSIDHIGGRKDIAHKMNLKSIHLYSWLRRNNFPGGYQVLCFNCNSAKSDRGICPHKL